MLISQSSPGYHLNLITFYSAMLQLLSTYFSGALFSFILQCTPYLFLKLPACPYLGHGQDLWTHDLLFSTAVLQDHFLTVTCFVRGALKLAFPVLSPGQGDIPYHLPAKCFLFAPGHSPTDPFLILVTDAKRSYSCLGVKGALHRMQLTQLFLF